jgi:predicted NAD/FAD-dependent oxidoreductase
MATRRVGDWQWDHGMQYMTAETPQFQKLITPLPTWSNASNQQWYVGAPSQNQLVKELAAGIDISLQTRITGIAGDADRGWRLATEDSTLLSEPYDAIAIATPAPQARELLPDPTLSNELSRVAMTPCWALMVASPEIVTLPATIESPHEHIAWFAADHSKPDRPRGHGQYVLHATATWSERHLEDDKDNVTAELLAYFQEIVGAIEISYATAHRWRYALTRSALKQPCAIDASARIGLCGDWCLGDRVEHGYRSGLALGEALADCF